jgi:hypothetical protein
MFVCSSSVAQHPLSDLLSDDIAADVIDPYCNSVLFGLADVLVSRLQSVQNAAARVVFNLRLTIHVIDAQIYLNWLQMPERIRSKVAVQVYRSLKGTSLPYRWTFTQTSAITARSNLRSVSRLQPVAPRCCLCSLGNRAFQVSGATFWNEPPTNINSALL